MESTTRVHYTGAGLVIFDRQGRMKAVRAGDEVDIPTKDVDAWGGTPPTDWAYIPTLTPTAPTPEPATQPAAAPTPEPAPVQSTPAPPAQ